MKRLFLTYLLITGFLGCDLFDNGEICPEPEKPFFDINGLQALNYSRVNAGLDLEVNDTISFEDHFITVQYEGTYHANVYPHSKGFSLIPTAFATLCLPNGGRGSKETLKDIFVTTNFDMSPEHLKGDTINELLNIDVTGNPEDLEAYLQADSLLILNPFFNLTFKEKPSQADSISLNIEVQLDNGEIHTASSSTVIYN